MDVKDMYAKEATTTEDFEQILEMAKDHPAVEYDCGYETYADVIRKTVGSPAFKGWILYGDDEEAAGYIMAIRENLLKNQINVVDIYLDPEARGMGRFKMLTDKVVEWAEMVGALRVTWTSKWPLKKWSDKLNLKLSEYTTFILEVQ